MNDEELNRFQVRCFNAPLQPEELLGVKKVVQDKMADVRLRARQHLMTSYRPCGSRVWGTGCAAVLASCSMFEFAMMAISF